jgi:hypothetical protein
MIRTTSALLLMGLLALACGSPEPAEQTAEQTAEDERRARLYRAEASLDAAPGIVREEVLKTCDKWKHIDRPCVDEDVRTDQLECWLEAGIPELQHALRLRIGPRNRNLKVLLMQNVCMEQRRWRKLKRGPDY